MKLKGKIKEYIEYNKTKGHIDHRNLYRYLDSVTHIQSYYPFYIENIEKKTDKWREGEYIILTITSDLKELTETFQYEINRNWTQKDTKKEWIDVIKYHIYSDYINN